MLEEFADGLECCERVVLSHECQGGEFGGIESNGQRVKGLGVRAFDDVSDILFSNILSFIKYSNGTKTIWSGKAAIAGYCLASESKSNKNIPTDLPLVGENKTVILNTLCTVAPC